MQIKNLSAAQVQPFGEILSAESELLPPCAERWQIRPGADVRELRADGPVVLDYVSGKDVTLAKGSLIFQVLNLYVKLSVQLSKMTIYVFM